MSGLFSELKIRCVTFRNRIAVSPMCQYSSIDGFTNDWHLVHLGSRAVGGFGLIIMEATAVSPEGRITPGDAGLWKDEHIDCLKRIVNFIHLQGSVAAIQIAHAGRKASCSVPKNGGKQLDKNNGGWQTVAPSALAFGSGDRLPESLDKKGITKVISDFRSSVIRAREAGFKVIEIHSAHGYLLHEFLSPLSNNRTDEYGGSFENRTRLLREIVTVVRSIWPQDNPLFVRLSVTDWKEGGWTLEESVRLASVLKDMGVDLIDCSSGGIVPDTIIPAGPNYQVPFAHALRNTGILTGAVGFITGAMQAESVINDGKADLILMAREILRNPYFPLKAAKELGVEIDWPAQYIRAK